MTASAGRAPNIEVVIERWAALGVGFNVPAAPVLPDVERLLLDTARRAHEDARLVIMAASWLADRPTFVARHRLAHLITSELERERHPAMGLILDLGAAGARTSHFNLAIRACQRASESGAGPLLEIDCATPGLRAVARRRASDVSKYWGRWFDPVALKPDALRPAALLADRHHELRLRAAFKGDLRASIMAELCADAGAGASELELARRCGATRAAVRAALIGLEQGGWIARGTEGRRRTASARTTAA